MHVITGQSNHRADKPSSIRQKLLARHLDLFQNSTIIICDVLSPINNASYHHHKPGAYHTLQLNSTFLHPHIQPKSTQIKLTPIVTDSNTASFNQHDHPVGNRPSVPSFFVQLPRVQIRCK